MFIAALFIITRTWKPPKCPSTEEWIKMWYIIQWTNTAICKDMGGPRGHLTECIKPERGKQMPYNITYLWNLEKW